MSCNAKLFTSRHCEVAASQQSIEGRQPGSASFEARKRSHLAIDGIAMTQNDNRNSQEDTP